MSRPEWAACSSPRPGVRQAAFQDRGMCATSPGRDGDMRAIRFAMTGRRVQEASLARLLERQILA
jgi:hypothetical protein